MSRAAISERRRTVAVVLLGVLLATLGLAGGAVQVLRAAASEPAPAVPEQSAETSTPARSTTVATPALPMIAVDPAAGVRRQRVGGPSDFPGSLGSAPPAAVAAYQRAAVILESASQCALEWTVLAAIGRVESDHGRGPALRAPLDGRGGRGELADTDGGVLDHDRRWDAPVGPMTLLPSTWRSVAVDADGDGARNPRDLDDAALAAAVLLCSQGGLEDPAALKAALASYHRAAGFVPTVLALAARYERQAGQVPPPPVVELPLPVLPDPCRCLAARPGPAGAPTSAATSAGHLVLVPPTPVPTTGGTSPTPTPTPSAGPTDETSPTDASSPTDSASPTEASPTDTATPTDPTSDPSPQETP